MELKHWSWSVLSQEMGEQIPVSCVTKLQFVLSISHSAAVRVTVFASFTLFRVRSHNFSLWLLQTILTYVHKKLRSVNQCCVTSCRKAVNRQQEEKVLPAFQGKGELALIFKTLSQVIDAVVFLERRGN